MRAAKIAEKEVLAGNDQTAGTTVVGHLAEVAPEEIVAVRDRAATGAPVRRVDSAVPKGACVRRAVPVRPKVVFSVRGAVFPGLAAQRIGAVLALKVGIAGRCAKPNLD